jgi:hypothetical protein
MLNDGSHTYLHPAYGTYSAIDLIILEPQLRLDFSWRVWDDLCGSDHFPIIIDCEGPSPIQKERTWWLHKAEWPTFQTLCRWELTIVVRDIKEFTEILRSIAEETVPKTSPTPKHLTLPWLNDECRPSLESSGLVPAGQSKSREDSAGDDMFHYQFLKIPSQICGEAVGSTVQ